MAKLRKEAKTDISAMLSDDVVTRKYRNQTLISKIKRPRKSDSAKRKETNERFADASRWATRTLKDPAMKALYSKGINSKLRNAHAVARTDYLTRPTIHYISLKQYTGAAGDNIRIKATDDFEVTTVDVRITDKNGSELEKGPAVRYKRKPSMWLYPVAVANAYAAGTVITVTVRDRPGNIVSKTETVAGS